MLHHFRIKPTRSLRETNKNIFKNKTFTISLSTLIFHQISYFSLSLLYVTSLACPAICLYFKFTVWHHII
uniref:Uncharacterized protein n=1 Tax=Anguilla anguilla TaxID=7936 RepID=A0A0E9XEN1_ANGAN